MKPERSECPLAYRTSHSGSWVGDRAYTGVVRRDGYSAQDKEAHPNDRGRQEALANRRIEGGGPDSIKSMETVMFNRRILVILFSIPALDVFAAVASLGPDEVIISPARMRVHHWARQAQAK
jgi:hypothetical protein